MNDLIGNNYDETEEQLKAKKCMKIIGIILVILLFLCIGLVVLMYYIDSAQLKISIDGVSKNQLEDLLIIENDKVYVPIRAFASYVGYESYSGDYKQYAEDQTKCYVQCANEIASFTMNSDKIYKLLTNGTDYEYFTLDEPIKMINGNLYITSEGAQTAFNITFTYNKEQNQIVIYTLPYLVTYWAGQFENSAIAEDGANFSNQKPLLYNMVVVKNADEFYGVYDLSGNEILGTKYASIEFIESTKEFIVRTAENKMGIMSYDSTTKISPEYDEIKQIDKDSGLYLVRNNNKEGVINNSGNVIVYLEYDQIGIDSSKFNSNNIKNQYLLYDNCIPVKLNNKWGLFDKTGKNILPVEYDDLGCSIGTNTATSQTVNNILLIPDYEGIVVKKDELYGLVDSQGNELLPTALTSIYSTISAGEETYHMIYNNQEMNVITYIETYIKPTTEGNEQTNENTNNETNVNNEPTSNNQVNTEAETNSTDIENNTNVTNNENPVNNEQTIN